MCGFLVIIEQKFVTVLVLEHMIRHWRSILSQLHLPKLNRKFRSRTQIDIADFEWMLYQ